MENVKENTELSQKATDLKKAFLEMNVLMKSTQTFQIEMGLKDAEHREMVNALEQSRELIEQQRTIHSFFQGEDVRVKFMQQFYSVTLSHAKIDKIDGEESLMMQCMFDMMSKL